MKSILAKNDPFNPYRCLINEFASFGEFLSPGHASEWLACYGKDSQSFNSHRIVLVFRPDKIEMISSFIAFCYQAQMPVVTRCGGTGWIPQRGIILLTGHFRAISDYKSQTGQVTVEPGVTPRQLNHYCQKDGWYLPLEMPTSGVAGLAGCLSTRARGYHQAGDIMTSSVLSLTLVDEKGQQREVTSAYACGVIIKLHLQLTRKPQKRIVIQIQATLAEWKEKKEAIQHYTTAISLFWPGGNDLILILEGEGWRVDETYRSIKRFWSFCRLLPSDWTFSFTYPPTSTYIIISSAVPSSQLPLLIPLIPLMCEEASLAYRAWGHVLEGTLHILLFTKESSASFVFDQKVEQFLILWEKLLENYQGFLIRHNDL